MSLLTEKEIYAAHDTYNKRMGPVEFARAIEQAVMAKLLAFSESVAKIDFNAPYDIAVTSNNSMLKDVTELLTHQVPEGWPSNIEYNSHFVGRVDDLFDEAVIEHSKFPRTYLVFIAAAKERVR